MKNDLAFIPRLGRWLRREKKLCMPAKFFISESNSNMINCFVFNFKHSRVLVLRNYKLVISDPVYFGIRASGENENTKFKG